MAITRDDLFGTLDATQHELAAAGYHAGSCVVFFLEGVTTRADLEKAAERWKAARRAQQKALHDVIEDGLS